MAGSGERRDVPRVEVFYRAGVTLEESGETLPAELLDISSGGCKVRVKRRLSRGGAVTVTILPFGALRAVVVWWRDGLAGLRFTEPAERVGELASAMATYRPL